MPLDRKEGKARVELCINRTKPTWLRGSLYDQRRVTAAAWMRTYITIYKKRNLLYFVYYSTCAFDPRMYITIYKIVDSARFV